MRDKVKEYVKEFCKGCSNTVFNGNPTDCKECLNAFVDAVDNIYNKPSTDFTEVLSNPNKRYLVYCSEHKSWFIGYCSYGDDFLSVDGLGQGARIFLNPSHWLPLPPDP